MAGRTAEIKLDFVFKPYGFILDVGDEWKQSKDSGIIKQFYENKYLALYNMGLGSRQERGSAAANFLYFVADNFFKRLTKLPEIEIAREDVKIPPDDGYEELLQAVPFATGSEFITKEWITNIFEKLLSVFAEEISNYNGTVEMYFTEKNQHLHVPERIFFHLVENKNEQYPFAFMATYATKKSDGNVQHMPLEYALQEYKTNKDKLLSLLSCLEKAADVSKLVAGFMQSGELFHPLRLTADEAYIFLKDIEAIEKTGILCRIPNWWKKRSSSLSVSIKLGEDRPSILGVDAILSVKPEFVIDGVKLSKEDIKKLITQTEGLAFIKGKWVEADKNRIKKLIEDIKGLPSSVTLMEALKMQAGTEADKQADIGGMVTNGRWLSGMLKTLREPGEITNAEVPGTLNATLRPYQQDGYAWLSYMYKLGFGACLADDMGLGKTVQVLAFLEHMRNIKKGARALLIVPASLVENWRSEIKKFVPGLSVHVLHGRPAKQLEEELPESKEFLTIVTYGMLTRIPSLCDASWECVILDEAQAVKNALAKQTKQVKMLKSRMRIAMTGTPVENDLMNLWSLFDFLNKGLLGTSKEFKSYVKGISEHQEKYGRLKSMVSPFMLRRLKTDKNIISDLPEKVEITDYAGLSKKQTVLYRKIVTEMEAAIKETKGINRKGLVLATITKLKQVCNHPCQYLGQEDFTEPESGKLELLREICETIYEKRERVLVFTQYKEITGLLAGFLEKVFHRKGRIIHGSISTAKRGRIVEEFQSEEYIPFLVLSTKAGGTGLNLTNANHVIHFDRWWNPAVENQATDRAFRIGQSKNVIVHKFVCKGTIEEKIDELIQSKKDLAENVIGQNGENFITEFDNDTLIKMMKLG